MTSCIEGNVYVFSMQLSEITEHKLLILEENFRWHLEAFASELFVSSVF